MPLQELADEEARASARGGVEKRRYVRRMFTEIAPRYDLLNRLLSFNIDRVWRRHALRALHWERAPDGVYIDLCAGTMDVGAGLARQRGFRGAVVAADFAEAMLRAGVRKAPVRLSPVVADALALPVASASVDGAVVAFGLRNLADFDAGLAEAYRVLRPGRRFVILEFNTPRSAVIRAVYNFYFRVLLPRIGRLVSGHPTAYAYLPESVAHFPGPTELAERMAGAGFRNVEFRALTFGIAVVHAGER